MFKESLKNYESEELTDLLIFRPVAHLFVRLFYHTNLTPNQISFLSVVSCFIASVLYAYAAVWSFVVGAVFYFFYCVLDCVDGQIARLKGTGTKTGRIVDGVADYVSHFFLFTGLIIAMLRLRAAYPLPFFPEIVIPGWVWILATAVTVMSHAMLLDHHRNIFIAITRGEHDWEEDEVKVFKDEYKRLKNAKEKLFERIIIKAYLFYTSFFLLMQGNSKRRKKMKSVAKYDPKDYYKKNLFAIRMWGFIGGSTNILIFSVMSALWEIKAYFWFTIFITNIYAIFMIVLQAVVRRFVKKRT